MRSFPLTKSTPNSLIIQIRKDSEMQPCKKYYLSQLNSVSAITSTTPRQHPQNIVDDREDETYYFVSSNIIIFLIYAFAGQAVSFLSIEVLMNLVGIGDLWKRPSIMECVSLMGCCLISYEIAGILYNWWSDLWMKIGEWKIEFCKFSIFL